MWESPVYRFSRETTDRSGKIIEKPFLINVTFSVPRRENGPGDTLIDVFKAATSGLAPHTAHVLDVGAGKLRNTSWFLQKGFNVWSADFEELRTRLEDAREKWEAATAAYQDTFHPLTPPNQLAILEADFFDLILLINAVNIMPLPLERFAILHLCRQRVKKDGFLLWHQWHALHRGKRSIRRRQRTVRKKRYAPKTSFGDGYLRGVGPNHTFYVEHTPNDIVEMLYSAGFCVEASEKIPSKILTRARKGNYSYLFRPTHEPLISKTLDVPRMLKTPRDPQTRLQDPEPITALDLYLQELPTIAAGRAQARAYQRLASRIFFQLFDDQLQEPVEETKIDEDRGRIDISYKNGNVPGIFKDLSDLRGIRCPEIFVECKNYTSDPGNPEFNQLGSRLSPARGMLGFLLCRKIRDRCRVDAHCKDWLRGGRTQYIVVLDDDELCTMAKLKRGDDGQAKVNGFVYRKIKAIID